MIPLEIGKTYEPSVQEPHCRVRRTVLEIGEDSLGEEYIKFLDLIEIRGLGAVSRQDFEDWMEGRGLVRSWAGGHD